MSTRAPVRGWLVLLRGVAIDIGENPVSTLAEQIFGELPAQFFPVLATAAALCAENLLTVDGTHQAA